MGVRTRSGNEGDEMLLCSREGGWYRACGCNRGGGGEATEMKERTVRIAGTGTQR